MKFQLNISEWKSLILSSNQIQKMFQKADKDGDGKYICIQIFLKDILSNISKKYFWQVYC